MQHRCCLQESTQETVFRKGAKSLNVCTKLLYIFYKSVVNSAICFAFICRGSSIRPDESKELTKLIKEVDSVLGTALEPLDMIAAQVIEHKEQH